jgi:hypothetical protein
MISTSYHVLPILAAALSFLPVGLFSAALASAVRQLLLVLLRCLISAFCFWIMVKESVVIKTYHILTHQLSSHPIVTSEMSKDANAL